jgi:surfactin synthase thioesterase subunit
VSTPGAWLARTTFDGEPLARVIAIPYAGGGTASYAGWARALAPHRIEIIPIKLPGREHRLSEPPIAEMTTIVDAIAAAAATLDDAPLALFGYSMGALIAFEVARALAAMGAPPAHLFAAAAAAPHVPRTAAPIHRLPDDELLEAVDHRYGGLPPAVRQHPELKQLVVPPLRADLTIVEQYRVVSGPPLACDLSAFSGRDDPLIDATHVDRWREITTGRFERRVFAGDHFFLRTSAPAIREAIARSLIG